MTERASLVVLAKAPVPGRAKTRLCPPLSLVDAAALAEAMLRDVLVRAWPVGRRTLATFGAGHPAWDEAEALGWRITEQRGEHLGARMWNAACDARGAHTQPVLILGTDAPHVAPVLIDEALDAVGTHDAAVVPAADGGYVAIAVHANALPLFGRLSWGTPEVLSQTLRAAERSGLRLHVTPSTYDLDEIADLRRLWVDSPAVLPTNTLAQLGPHAVRLGWSAQPSPLSSSECS